VDGRAIAEHSGGQRAPVTCRGVVTAP
jgi:hypothetical protein